MTFGRGTLLWLIEHATEQRIDQALEDSFPASDPPFFVGAGSKPGSPPPKRRPPGQWRQDYGYSSFVAIRH